MITNILKAEYYKFKGTKLFYVLLIGALILPIFSGVNHFFTSVIIPNEFATAMSSVVTLSLTFMILIFGTIMINSLFGVDLKNNVLKSIIPLPVSRKEYLKMKLITLLVWMLVFAFVTWLVSVILFIVFGLNGFDLTACFNGLWQLLLGTFLLFLVMTPIVFVYLVCKNSSITIILAFILILLPFIAFFTGDSLKFLEPVLNYLPWTTISSFVTGVATGINPIYEIIAIILVFIIGYLLRLYRIPVIKRFKVKH
ncbi:MAG: ABC transporter permease [Methanobacteriaceae archaeon]|nr:ABC transporter permease [Methanobacteriaceae archaeon]